MNTRLVGASLVGAMSIYVFMAACGASSSTGSGGPTGSSAGGLDGFADSLTSPVTAATADPLPPDVAIETCSKQYTGGGEAAHFAEHLYPGKTAVELSAVRVLAHWSGAADPLTAGGPSYEYIWGYPRIADGAVAVNCGPANYPPTYDKVTFILPQ